jgi:hypothetical protein
MGNPRVLDAQQELLLYIKHHLLVAQGIPFLMGLKASKASLSCPSFIWGTHTLVGVKKSDCSDTCIY